ncbi:hypothetical protein Psta_0662 [Pirellula staleyi DSM 6068]|uniref:Uncharacterized protein n=1 Tax=Pirellula staleyi (strain ATCC 27377 / DSM 6068 / ICPB 4128) TaxID=530564 RepID=D2R589_PIRSD|nr:hypothetical protein Psta_0662 [Pirellula staleyi DSM 6068]
MSSRKRPNSLPPWFRLLCGATPLAVLVIVTLSVAFGVSVSPTIFATIATLASAVICKVLGIRLWWG